MKRTKSRRTGKKKTKIEDPVKKLLRQNPEAASAEEVVEKLAKETVEQARLLGWGGPPFDPKVLASLKGITLTPKLMPDNQDARLIPDKNGNLELEYNISKPETRQNYSIAHDVAHTFLPDYEQRIQNRQIDDDPHYDEVEHLCDYAASYLLLPEPEFPDDMMKLGGVGLNAFEALRITYEASREATANRLVRLSTGKCAVVYFHFCLKPIEQEQLKQAQGGFFPPETTDELGIYEKLRVSYSIGSDSFRLYIPKDKSIEDDSPLVDIAKSRSSFEGEIPLNFGRGEKVFYVEATSYPVDDDPDSDHGVIAFIFPN